MSEAFTQNVAQFFVGGDIHDGVWPKPVKHYGEALAKGLAGKNYSCFCFGKRRAFQDGEELLTGDVKYEGMSYFGIPYSVADIKAGKYQGAPIENITWWLGNIEGHGVEYAVDARIIGLRTLSPKERVYHPETGELLLEVPEKGQKPTRGAMYTQG